ncbi:peptidase C1B bleomycin hydrolase [Heliocybe sulcata]|uniref:Cysteine proteinase 1, mitochondrial n=1 Tax=Heliocybe sulcata TaxID=5364 RepID=A0A5C3NAB4_9AGAM|nr:peptidase C1B bleomycin hydrolase [Heliocybe sulcata]
MGSAPSKPASAPQVAPSDNEKQTLVESFSSLRVSPESEAAPAPLSADGSLSLSNLSSWESDLASDSKTQLARTVFAQSNIKSILTSRSTIIKDSHVFNTEVDFKTDPITNQKSSGRCWLFATSNIFRYNVMKKLSLNDFQCSQSYLFFYDKLNKANYYLELSIELADLPLDDRLLDSLSGDLISDGGQWDMAINVLENYGIVPQALYPESTHSSLSSPLNTILKTKLREHGIILRDLTTSLRASSQLSEDQIRTTLRSKKEELMKEVYTIMTATLGVPPRPDEKFTYDYYNKDGKAQSWEGTPLDFYKTFQSKQYSPSSCFSLINDPRNEYGKLYTVDKLGNVWGGRPVLYVNTDIADLKKAVVTMVKAGVPVFFGCDVGQFSENSNGIMDIDLMEYENAFNIKFGLTKAQRLQVNESAMTHAMVISGVHLDAAGNPVRYKVENSWGPDVGDKGYFVMTDKWFEQFVYQVVVPKALAQRELVKVYEGGNPVVLPHWDPMGALA